jgi:hypothetical protein
MRSSDTTVAIRYESRCPCSSGSWERRTNRERHTPGVAGEPRRGSAQFRTISQNGHSMDHLQQKRDDIEPVGRRRGRGRHRRHHRTLLGFASALATRARSLIRPDDAVTGRSPRVAAVRRSAISGDRPNGQVSRGYHDDPAVGGPGELPGKVEKPGVASSHPPARPSDKSLREPATVKPEPQPRPSLDTDRTPDRHTGADDDSMRVIGYPIPNASEEHPVGALLSIEIG